MKGIPKLVGIIALICLFLIPCGSPHVSAASLDTLLDPIRPDVTKWASVLVIQQNNADCHFEWHHYRNSADAVDFWPASTIKIYTVVAALEYLNQLGMPTDSILIFERKTDGQWRQDTSRSMREMISEVFRRSSNEDYTLLLRFVGIDRINTQFLIPERGFPHTALMRDYVTHRPVVYENTEPQRIRVLGGNGASRVVEHTWSGVSYAAQRGATILSGTTGNCTSTRELAECLRRIMFHERIPASERYQLTEEQLELIRFGKDGLCGLENRKAGPYAWEGLRKVFPQARYFHKAGLISNYCLDLAYVEDNETETRFILSLAARTGDEDSIREMAEVVARWIRSRSRDGS
jgi:hypothetical protein